jgi:hypothetical protein
MRAEVNLTLRMDYIDPIEILHSLTKRFMIRFKIIENFCFSQYVVLIYFIFGH